MPVGLERSNTRTLLLDAAEQLMRDEGYAAVMLTDTANFRNPHYHLPSDTLDTLNIEFLAAVSDIVVGCIEDLAGARRR